MRPDEHPGFCRGRLYFEADPPFPEGDKRRFGYWRDHRPDCVQIIIALVEDPAKLWDHYLLLMAVEAAFKNFKGDLVC